MFVSRKRFEWGEIQAYYDAGHNLIECKERFGFSNGAWDGAVKRGDIVPRARMSGKRSHATRDAVHALLGEGISRAEIADRLGVSRPTVTYHAKRLGFESAAAAGRRYDWDEIRSFYDQGHSARECCARFGFSLPTWHDAVKRGRLEPRPKAPPLVNYLVVGRRVNRYHLKRHLLDARLKESRCERCGIGDWLGRELTMALHHVNGDGSDNRLENLQLLCPNCHSQTDNFAGRNVRRLRPPDEPGEEAADA
jgi:DNA-binding CsgD family transcriptional regulator/5-methylcytosine-specific restriction endonuclease McrA